MQRLEIWLYSCRGKNDAAEGKNLLNFSQYKFLVCLVNASGGVFGFMDKFNDNEKLNLGAFYERSRGLGWNDFLSKSKSEWYEWVINNHLHIICKLEPLLH